MMHRTLAAALVVLAGAAMDASAQHYRGEGGTALDRNFQVGSGGKNPRARDIRDQIWFNNQIIVGNAPAGRSFRGYVGYTAPSDFRGTAGSDSLYSFRRDSTSAGQVATGVRVSDALRYQMALTTGQAAPSYLAQTYFTPREATAATASNAVPVGAALRSTADYLTSRALRPTIVGARLDPTGAEWNATASPLLGVTWMRVSPNAVLPPIPEVAPAAATTTPGLPATDQGRAPITPGAPAPAATEPEPPVRDFRSMVPTGLESRSLLARPGWDRAVPRSPIDSSATAGAAPVRSATHTRLLEGARQAYGTGTTIASRAEQPSPDAASSTTPGQDGLPSPTSYLDRDLDRIRAALRGESLRPARPADGRTTTAPGDRAAARSPQGDDRQPAGREGEAADDAEKPDPFTPDVLKALRDIGRQPLPGLVPDAAAADPEIYRIHMQAGEQALADGRYFDAEDRFTRAIAAMPDDAIAKVGRVQAQLGAGLLLSASTNLRRLLADNPETAAMRFDPRLAPRPERVASLTEQLRREIDQGSIGMGQEASLLLAYLGRTTGDQALVDEGLTAMGQRLAPDEPQQHALHRLLTEVWSKPAANPSK